MSIVQVTAALFSACQLQSSQEEGFAIRRSIYSFSFINLTPRCSALAQPLPHSSSSGWTKLVNSQCLWLSFRDPHITARHTHRCARMHTHAHTHTHPQIPLICLLLEVDLSPLDVDLVLCLLNQWNMVRVMLSSFWTKKVSYWQPPYLSKCPLLKISHSVTGKFVGEAHAEREQNLKLSTPAELPANSQDQIASPGSKPSCTYILQPLVKLPHWCCISGADKPSLLSPAETACLWAGYFVLLSH